MVYKIFGEDAFGASSFCSEATGGLKGLYEIEYMFALVASSGIINSVAINFYKGLLC
ncbi:hypothetical protein DCCM_4665 [Desulfocucumis palustris]|uniref:Uncharacterized protein n=1 Tax=Desulfocucumis palustris TaxID=1898651 RepID=A0A2L2XMH5_9FIRM|nr:hypothetical protein DCCM_4665 [Desulfocucumis palustris]